MVLHGSTWFYMVLHGSAWFCMVLHGSTWFYMVLHGSTSFSFCKWQLDLEQDFLNCCIRSLRVEWNEKRLAITGNDDGCWAFNCFQMDSTFTPWGEVVLTHGSSCQVAEATSSFGIWRLMKQRGFSLASQLQKGCNQHPLQFDSAPNPLFCWMCQTQTIGETARKPRRR